MFKDKTIALLHRVIIMSACIACMRDNEGGLLAGMMLEEANELEAFVHMFMTQASQNGQSSGSCGLGQLALKIVALFDADTLQLDHKSVSASHHNLVL